MPIDFSDPNLDFQGQSDIIARALREAQSQRDARVGGPQFHGKWNVTGSAIPTILANALGQYGVNAAEAQQTALNKEQLRRFDDISKQLGTPGTRKTQVLRKTLSGDQQGPEQTVEEDVPLSPVEENQRQMVLGMQMSKLPMARGIGQEFVKSGAAFPEKMAAIQSQQQQAKMLAAQKAQERISEISMRMEDRSLDRASREALAREGMDLRRSLAEISRSVAGANSDLQRELMQARIDKLREPKPPSKESVAAEKARHEAALGIAAIDDTIRELDKPEAKNALGPVNVLPGAVRQYTDPKGVAARAAVANIGSMKLHDRSGAAITVGEMPRLVPFIPAVTDDVSTAKVKLKKMRDEYSRMQDEWDKGRGASEAYQEEGSAPVATSRKVYNPATGQVE